MKLLKTVIMTVALLWGLPSVAQKLEYRDFKETNEQTARLQGTAVTDENTFFVSAII